jgi:hypothetical protein
VRSAPGHRDLRVATPHHGGGAAAGHGRAMPAAGRDLPGAGAGAGARSARMRTLKSVPPGPLPPPSPTPGPHPLHLPPPAGARGGDVHRRGPVPDACAGGAHHPAAGRGRAHGSLHAKVRRHHSPHVPGDHVLRDGDRRLSVPESDAGARRAAVPARPRGGGGAGVPPGTRGAGGRAGSAPPQNTRSAPGAQRASWHPTRAHCSCCSAA